MKGVIFFILITFSSVSFAQEAQLTKYKSMFTMNFMRYIGWPDGATKGDFVIGVLKDKPVLGNLQKLTVSKKFGYQPIVVKEFKSVEDVTDCQILFVGGGIKFSKNSEVLKQKLQGKNSLIITETEGATKSGSMINFVVRGGKLKFEIHSANASVFGLKFSNKLSSLSNAIVK